MPNQRVQSYVPADEKKSSESEHMSVVEFDLDENEEIFLTYTWERAEGPDIRRTGMGPPYMSLIGGAPGTITTHPFGLRLGTWLIQEAMRKDELDDAKKELNEANKRPIPQADIEVLDRTVKELDSLQLTKAHDRVFLDNYPNYEIVAQQGCGDLTMNSWNVAYVNSVLGQGPNELICLPHEPIEDRTYTCLIKWKATKSRDSSLSIQEVRFNRKCHIRLPNEMVWVQTDGNEWVPRGNAIEFAVSNQPVIREGNIVPVTLTYNQFGDLRHLIHMPNLNPEVELYAGETFKAKITDNNDPSKSRLIYRPRQYFNKKQEDDIWMGEAAFLQDKSQNLLRAALTYPVFLSLPPDANEEILRGALSREQYNEVANESIPLAEGQWRFLRRGPQITVLEIFFKRNCYGWTMIGLSSNNRKLLLLACTGKPGKSGYILEEAAKILKQAGAWDALLVDEGADVFQFVRRDDGVLKPMVPSKRRRLRATFIIARPVAAQKGEEA